jgi:hypothetical protein
MHDDIGWAKYRRLNQMGSKDLDLGDRSGGTCIDLTLTLRRLIVRLHKHQIAQTPLGMFCA